MINGVLSDSLIGDLSLIFCCWLRVCAVVVPTVLIGVGGGGELSLFLFYGGYTPLWVANLCGIVAAIPLLLGVGYLLTFKTSLIKETD